MLMKEMIEIAKKVYTENEDDYTFIGIRFENKERKIGDVCEHSKNNSAREDERDFPEFGTEEYEEMPEFDGTSAWNLIDFKVNKDNENMDTDSFYIDEDHCYIIAGKYNCNADDGLDDGEIVIEDAKVIAKIF